MQWFLATVMCPSDRCSIAAFNRNYLRVADLEDEATAITALHVLRDKCTGSTRMYDCVKFSVVHHILTADPRRPWLLIILTDGEDNESEATAEEAATVLRRFISAGNDNSVVIIGVGQSSETRGLSRIAADSGSTYVHARDAGELERLFGNIALQVTEGVRVNLAAVETQDARALFARVERTRSLRRQAVDMLFLVDVSASMETRD
eukprot:CAMPEP_0174847340 /NCGR_PEP_ID=MMETSP1114-20130205/12853_1 /TAXON_ID=312471 /ORGANISM="Neobodo designis, Strain CCAP 1951/1" /LENGTH=205 /DNA_ID=CAMNT_0016081613 /DNA_START=12 /DNA_END=629 /DNA_ORIENTATION=-